MAAETIEKALPFCGLALDAVLCLVMLYRRRVGSFPALFAFVALDLLSGSVLSYIDSSGTSQTYSRAYFLFDATSFLVQILILLELARNVLKPTGIWEKRTFKTLSFASAAGASLALFAVLTLQPGNLGVGQIFQLRADTFTGLLTSEVVIAMMLSASKFGLPWRSHVMAVGQGLMLWSLVIAFIDGLEIYLGPKSHFYGALYYIRSINYFVVLTYWTVSLWRDEPARRPISPALRKYVIALHERVQYDLGKVGH